MPSPLPSLEDINDLGQMTVLVASGPWRDIGVFVVPSCTGAGAGAGVGDACLTPEDAPSGAAFTIEPMRNGRRSKSIWAGP